MEFKLPVMRSKDPQALSQLILEKLKKDGYSKTEIRKDAHSYTLIISESIEMDDMFDIGKIVGRIVGLEEGKDSILNELFNGEPA